MDLQDGYDDGGRPAGRLKTAIGTRCKHPGMFRAVLGANAVLALPCTQLNGRFEDYWAARRA